MQATIVSLEPKTIKDHLLHAKNKGLKFPRLVFGDYKFTLAPDTGRNAGAVYVKHRVGGTDVYLGKVIANDFYSPFASPKDFSAITMILHRPIAAATLHGQKTGTCCCCGRELTAEESINKMIGPICAEKYGF